jgi:hypothetical protein
MQPDCVDELDVSHVHGDDVERLLLEIEEDVPYNLFYTTTVFFFFFFFFFPPLKTVSSSL